jgi:hypothetical protein
VPFPKSRKFISPKRRAANRANAARSTGPRTPAGKARSAQNARRHGFAAVDFTVVRVEDREAVAALRADLVAVYQPVNAQELFAIERIALAQHAILRAARLEAGLFTCFCNDISDDVGHPVIYLAKCLIGERHQNGNYTVAEGFRRSVHDGAWALFLRYQAQAERHYRRAVEEFERLKALRSELPNEPNFTAQADANAAASAPAETNPTPPPDPAPGASGAGAPPPVGAPVPAPGPAGPSAAIARPEARSSRGPCAVKRRRAVSPRPARSASAAPADPSASLRRPTRASAAAYVR